MLGIDIGSSSVRVVDLDQSGNSYVLNGYAIEDLPLGVVSDRTIHDVEAVGKTLEKAIKSARVKATQAAVAVGGSSVITRVVDVIKGVSDADVEVQLQLEADQYIPYPLDEVSIDFARLSTISPNDDTKEEVLLAACRKESIEVRESVLAFVGLTAGVVDLESYAMERAASLLPIVKKASTTIPVAVVDIGSTMLSFNIIFNDHIIYNREQMFGGRQLTEEIQRHYGLTFLDAERAKKKGELPDDYEESVLKGFMDQVSDQIARSLQFFFATGQYTSVDGIVLVGGGARVKQLTSYIQNKLNIPTQTANPFADMKTSSRINASALAQDAPALMIACGLAMRSFD
ncbi:pilus assembly protein PilM [Entomomonas moraniae]|uniref:Pilus assembly protein PilM n=1 Tax=Entomomonas moraniae TaxID=2213226 RepID=A0A3Q9JMM2_9GAMM|nr:type IV pilus assembly protein PilM [Entomomonas moraniae]AZS49670.1 pilus assembly protein PilM [Entomomonas moraniae]